ncbi:alpha/beta hydrolase [Micromonospora cathayae]|uniref:Alpha/beta hydrolase n=1 Tax=Micromonospora cathayae TaxID=3028804 RepID=A0ABY7ZQJ2_9ACTN|nr:alpha/beta hydrolase [Micromonospora sp. HUAS 3]WDZ85294.1 alpha/beta hydrolase [Micromonospora sp. HUAS 3]
MSGYARLWATDPAAWERAGTAWRGLDAVVGRRVAGLTAGAGRLRAAWDGPAAGAAGGRLTALRAELASVAPALIEVEQILAEFAGRLRLARARLAGAVDRADAAGLLVDRAGRVALPPAPSGPTGVPPTAPGPTVPARARGPAGSGPAGAGPAGPAGVVAGQAAEAARLSGEIAAALALVAAADREASARLGELTTAARTGWTTPPPGYRPPVGAAPELVRRWWAELTPAQRRWLVGHEPALVGRLDGLPATARDQANRLLLDAHRERLLAERRELLRRVPAGPAELAAVARVDARLAGLAALSDRLAAPAADGAPRAYLIGLDPTGDGRAVVALGNPDRADRVLTYVPGMTADLADAGGELGRAARVAARCAALEPGREVSAVLWLDYDAPDFVHEAYRARQAEDAAAGLHRFQEGLRAAHEGPAARQTVLGHSYGSLVVGTAAREHGLAADALVFVGSPGVGVDHAADLRLPPGQVWASTAGDDVIGLVRPPVELAGRAAVGGVLPWLAGEVVGRPDDDLWFGRDPSDPSFGGRTFPSGRYGHTGYWDPANPSLDGMARIVLGTA